MQTGSEIASALQALETALRQEIDAARAAATRQVVTTLNDAVRRLRHAESRDEWIRTVEETASAFCERAAFVSITSRTLSISGLDLPLALAPAIANAAESKDTVVSAVTESELSLPVMEALGEARRVILAPVLVHEKTVGVLCAAPGQDGDLAAIELLASLASASVITAPETTVESKPAELIRIAGLPQAAPPASDTPTSRRPWDDLSKTEQSMHLKAQRFARTAVAELVLNKSEAVRRGRASSNLYATLREEIDEGRDAFHRQFIETCPSMVDYFHLEMVRTLAKDDSRALGPDYPGPLP